MVAYKAYTGHPLKAFEWYGDGVFERLGMVNWYKTKGLYTSNGCVDPVAMHSYSQRSTGVYRIA
jgi:hypothetical protein